VGKDEVSGGATLTLNLRVIVMSTSSWERQ